MARAWAWVGPMKIPAARATAWMLARAACAAFAPTPSRACGACAEDKVAATYDHGVVVRAAAVGAVMVFCEVIGPFDAARLKATARRTKGVDPASVRVSVQPAALSFALDPKLHSPQAAVAVMQRGLPTGPRLSIVQRG